MERGEAVCQKRWILWSSRIAVGVVYGFQSIYVGLYLFNTPHPPSLSNPPLPFPTIVSYNQTFK